MTKLLDGFDLRARKPIDIRLTQENNDVKTPYEGLLKFQPSDKRYYSFIDGEYQDFLKNIEDSIESINNNSISKNALVFNIIDFGAKLDGVTDDTTALKNAILSAKDKCGVVFIPPSENGCLIQGDNINIPEGVTITGVNNNYKGFWVPKSKGSTLLITSTVNTTFKLNNGSNFKNLNIYYPNQTETNPPIAYPFLLGGIEANSNDIKIENIFLFNCYKFADFSISHERIIFRNIEGDILNTGIVIDHCWDVDKIENIHFWSYFSHGKTDLQTNALGTYRMNNAIGLQIGQADSIKINNIFMWGLKCGFKLGIETRGCYGIMNNISIDTCQFGFEVNTIGGQGLIINNFQYAINTSLKATYGVSGSCVPFVLNYATGLIEVSNMETWGGHDRLLFINPTFGVNSIFRINNINISDNATDEFIYNGGTGSVKISDLNSTTSKKLVYSENNVSRIVFENLNVPNEGFTGVVKPLIKRYDIEDLITIPSEFTINIGNARKVLITGTTAISNIVSYANSGSEITLIFNGSVTINSSTSYNIRLSSTFNATNNDTLTLIFDGVNWLEKCRSVNI